MKQDIDRLMEARGLDALIVTGPMGDNTPMKYLTGNAKLTGGLVVKVRDSAPVLIASDMEREEAAKSGLEVHTFSSLGYMELLQKYPGETLKAQVEFYGRIFNKFGIRGKVGFYGRGDPGTAYRLITALAAEYDYIEPVGEAEPTVFDAAYETKDADEIARLKDVGRRTCAVMGEALDFIKSHSARDGTIVKDDGSPLTIGDVKRFVRHRLLEYDLEDPLEMIFAQGRDAGVPHSHGEDDQPLRLGKSVIFDLFPRELGGGYFHDMTRTWCFGYAPDEVQEAYEQVMEISARIMAAYKVGEPASKYQIMAEEYFEERGHPTLHTNPRTREGYVHNLGHGVGLQVHESPRFSRHSVKSTLRIGNVFTIEPGLYYPDRGFGVRIEDTVYVDEDGKVVPITDFPKDLVIPLG